jgi:hypothetical protein
MMFSEGIPLPVKVIASVPPLMYGVMLFLATGTPRGWLGIIPVVFVLVFALMSYLDFPIAAFWPAFAGVFLITTCILATMWDIAESSPIPLTHSALELWAGAFLGCLYLIWGIAAARRSALYV